MASDPFPFGKIAVFWPGHSQHPAEKETPFWTGQDVKGYAFCETSEDGLKCNYSRFIVCKSVSELRNLLEAARFALERAEDEGFGLPEDPLE